MHRQKVLFVITKSNWGGAQAYVFTLATRFAAAGWDTAVAFGGTGLPGAPSGRLAERLAAAGIRTVELQSMARDLYARRDLRTFGELVRVIRAEQPDILHLNSSKAGFLGSVAGRVAGVPRIVFTAHGWPHREPRALLMRTIIWTASWLTVAFSHVVIAVSEVDRRGAPVLFSRRKVRTIHNGIAPFPRKPRADARAALAPAFKADTYWFFMNAELHTNKGIDRALEALASLLPAHPEARLVIVGTGEEGERLAARAAALGIAAQVQFCGFVPDARSYLSAADAFVLPSRKEGLPLVLLETGLAALPVIASATGGIPEVVTDGTSGWLVPVGDTGALAAAMRACLENPAEGARRGAALEAHVAASFSEDEMFDRTQEAYGR